MTAGGQPIRRTPCWGMAEALRDPELALSLANAPAAARPALAVLWRLDERLAAIVASPNRPIAAIKLAWWREALERLDSASPPAEPLLAEIAATLLPAGATGAGLAAIADGWDALLDGDEAEDAAAMIERHARARGGGLFVLVAALLNGGAAGWIAAEGEIWALATVPPPFDKAALAVVRARIAAAPAPRWPRRLRAIGVLAVLARDRARDADARAGSPRRVARALWHSVSGR